MLGVKTIIDGVETKRAKFCSFFFCFRRFMPSPYKTSLAWQYVSFLTSGARTAWFMRILFLIASHEFFASVICVGLSCDHSNERCGVSRQINKQWKTTVIHTAERLKEEFLFDFTQLSWVVFCGLQIFGLEGDIQWKVTVNK